MKMLKLHLDDLRIDSFDTTTPREEKGTVFGEESGYDTCDASCGGTCGFTCNASCNHSCVGYVSCEEWTPCGTCAYDTCNCGRTDFC